MQSGPTLKKVTQKILESIILPALVTAKKSQPEETVINLAKLATHLGYQPEFTGLNFAIENLTIQRGSSTQPTLSAVRGTSLLTHIDYSNCWFRYCNFNDCNLTRSQFLLTGFEKCKMNRVAMQSSHFEEVNFDKCTLNGASFDSTELDLVEFRDSQLTTTAFTHLKKCDKLTILDCELAGINFLGTRTTKLSEIAFSKETVVEDVYLFNCDIELVNAKLGKNKPAIGITACSQKPDHLVRLTKQALEDKEMQPLAIEYFPPMDEKQLIKLEREVTAASLVAKKMPEEKEGAQSISFAILKTALADPTSFPLINRLYHYAQTTIAHLDGFMLPGDADINPLMYGQEPKDKDKDTPMRDLRRDIIEFSFVHLQQKTGTPLYAIGRGSQVCGLSYGAELHTDISEDPSLLGDKVKLSSSPSQKAKTSHMHSLTQSLTPSKEKKEKDHVHFSPHQSIRLPENIAERALFEIIATTVGSDSERKLEFTIAAESLPRNIFMVQFHPEAGKDHDLGASPKLAASFLEGFSSRVDDYIIARNEGHLMRLKKKDGEDYLSTRHVHSITTPEHPEVKAKPYNSVVVGMGPTGLLAGLAAISRGERVAFLSDRPLSTGLGLREQTVGIDDEAFELVKELVDPEIYDAYVRRGQIVEAPYHGKSYFSFTTGAFEKLLLEELERRRHAVPPCDADIYEVAQIDKDLLERLSTPRQKDASDLKINKQLLQDLTSIRYQQNVDLTKQALTLAKVKSINGVPVKSEDSTKGLAFNHLLICNGGKRSIEKGLIQVGGDNVHSIYPVAPYHAAVIFELKNCTHTDCTQASYAVKEGKVQVEPVPLADLKKHAWEFPSRPHSQIYVTGSGKDDHGDRFYIGCEIPPALFKLANSPDAKDREKAKKDIRHFAHLLIKDRLPEEMWKNNIIDPEYKLSDPFERTQAVLSTSPFKLEFFELDRTCVLQSHSTKTPAMVAFFGDGRMLPLYTTGTGLQTGAKLVRFNHEALVKLEKELKNISDKTYSSEEARQKAIEKTYTDVFGEYHAAARAELDKIREVQHIWIETRNNREIKAAQFFEVHQSVIDVSSTLANLIKQSAVVEKDLSSPPVGRFFSQDSGPSLNNQLLKIKESLNKFFRNPETITSYEDLLGTLCKEEKMENPEKYYSELHEVCQNILHLVHQSPASLAKETFSLREALEKLIPLCEKGKASILEKQQPKKETSLEHKKAS